MKGPCEICGAQFSSSFARVCPACSTDIDTSTLPGALLQIYVWADQTDIDDCVGSLLRPLLPLFRPRTTVSADQEVNQDVPGYTPMEPLFGPGAFLHVFAVQAAHWGYSVGDYDVPEPSPAQAAAWAAWAESLASAAKAAATEEPPAGKDANKYERALMRVTQILARLEERLGERIGTTDDAMLLHRAIESCKFWKHPEFELKFAAPEDRPIDDIQQDRFDEWYAENASRLTGLSPQELAYAAWAKALHMDPPDFMLDEDEAT